MVRDMKYRLLRSTTEEAVAAIGFRHGFRECLISGTLSPWMFPVVRAASIDK